MEQRTDQQNKALHTYLTLVAHELQNGGHTMSDVVKVVDLTEVQPTKENVKEVIWRPIQQAMYQKKSTTELSTSEVDKVYQVMSQFLATNFEISLPFPSYEPN